MAGSLAHTARWPSRMACQGGTGAGTGHRCQSGGSQQVLPRALLLTQALAGCLLPPCRMPLPTGGCRQTRRRRSSRQGAGRGTHDQYVCRVKVHGAAVAGERRVRQRKADVALVCGACGCAGTSLEGFTVLATAQHALARSAATRLPPRSSSHGCASSRSSGLAGHTCSSCWHLQAGRRKGEWREL